MKLPDTTNYEALKETSIQIKKAIDSLKAAHRNCYEGMYIPHIQKHIIELMNLDEAIQDRIAN